MESRPLETQYWETTKAREGTFHNVLSAKFGMESLRSLFPEPVADEFNFVLFSTSGVHGSYTTIEAVERSASKYGFDYPHEREMPDDWVPPVITFVVIHTRVVGLRYGNAVLRDQQGVEYLKKLRQASWDVVAQVGRDANPHGL